MGKNILINSIKHNVSEHIRVRESIMPMAKKTIKQQTKRTSLGIGWIFLRDIIYFASFIGFRYLITGNAEVESMNFILYLLIGLIPWNFMSESITAGSIAIKNRKSILSSMNFPAVVLPTIEIISIVVKRLFTIVILFFVIYLFGDLSDITWWMFIYYFFCMFIFLCVWNLVFSSLVTISNDFEQLYRAFSGIMFFSVPVMWSFEILEGNPNIITLLKLNPFVYLIEGFQNACFRGTFHDVNYTLYFFGITFVFFCIGSMLQYKLKDHYIDLI